MDSSVSWEAVPAVCRNHPKVVAAWAFGSAADGRVRPGGDVDIGILVESVVDLDELASLRDELQASLEFDEIDLVLLNRTSPILQFQAVSGKLLFCRDPDQRAAFVSLVARQYEDELAFYHRALSGRE